ncbi:MAG: glycosyltransferase [Thermoplasmatota archaeon]
MKIAFFAEDGPERASSRVRCLDLAEQMRQRGHDVTSYTGCTFPKFSKKDPGLMLRRLRERRRELRQEADADVWFVHRGGRQYGLGALVARERRRSRAKMVFDMDDAVYLTHPRGSHALMDASDLVLAGNDNLAQHARSRGNAAEWFPTGLDAAAYDHPRRENEVPVIGWIGNRDNVPFLADAAAGVQEAARHHDLVLRVVCDYRLPLAIPVEGVPVERVQWTLDDAPKQAATFDLGLLPYPDTPWAQGKCAFKALEYMAAGGAAVASEVGDGGRLLDGGRLGYPVRPDGADWGERILEALDDPKERRRRAAAGQRYVQETHDLPRVAARLEERLERLLEGEG